MQLINKIKKFFVDICEIARALEDFYFEDELQVRIDQSRTKNFNEELFNALMRNSEDYQTKDIDNVSKDIDNVSKDIDKEL